MTRLRIALYCAITLFLSTRASATGYLGWADEFVTGHIFCNTSATGCNARSLWAGPFWLDPQIHDQNMFPTWSPVGMQGTNAAGRANVRSKIFFQYREVSTVATWAITATTNRYRYVILPAEGQPCAIGGGATYVGSAAHTISSLGSPVDTRVESRLLPSYNFSQETAVNTTIGYREDVIVSDNAGQSYAAPGCFKIRWN